MLRSLLGLKQVLCEKERLLGIDYGEKRIGLAISDTNLCTAVPINTLLCDKGGLDIQSFIRVIDSYGVGGLVLGLPLTLKGHDSQITHLVRNFASFLLNHSHMFRREPEITFWDERWSSVVVTRCLQTTGISRKKQTRLMDSASAAYILQGALDFLSFHEKTRLQEELFHSDIHSDIHFYKDRKGRR